MYIISRMESGVWFGECIEDGYYCESSNWSDVSEKMEEHDSLEMKCNN